MLSHTVFYRTACLLAGHRYVRTCDTVEHKTWVTIDKSSWGDGPWLAEPDKEQFADEATGLPCLIRRSPTSGALCGYVGVPEEIGRAHV